MNDEIRRMPPELLIDRSICASPSPETHGSLGAVRLHVPS